MHYAVLRLAMALPALLSVCLPAQQTTTQPDPSGAALTAPGISRALARDRAARIRGLQYLPMVRLEPGMERVRGAIAIRFELTAEGATTDLLLDFDGAGMRGLVVNGTAIPQPERVHNHVVLPAAQLREGANLVTAGFASDVGATGTPLTRYHDDVDGADYLYTLVVPADMHRLMPCFDQPDCRASVQWLLLAPKAWRTSCNTPRLHPLASTGVRQAPEFNILLDLLGLDKAPDELQIHAPSPPLPTYLMAFAAGPFEVIPTTLSSGPPTRLFLRKSKLDIADTELLLSMHHRAVQWMQTYVRTDYPFSKLDAVLLPGFPYGGMEHAGTIFYRERALVFDTEPTRGERTGRAALLYHEVAHQWFGNLVTMRWFDDLWLKEGFATQLSYRCMEDLEPDADSWLRFHQRVKPSALRVDGTRGTVPVAQLLENLADAKSTYGPIVYNKAPAILRELSNRVGEDAYRKGLQGYLADFRFGNADVDDFIRSIARAAETDLTRWTDLWVRTPGMPQVEVVATGDAEAGRVLVRQSRATPGLGGTPAARQDWPISLTVLCIARDGRRTPVQVVLDGPQADVPWPFPDSPMAAAIPNADDRAYGEFLLDPKSEAWCFTNLQEETDPLLKAVCLSALRDNVRELRTDPRRLADLCLTLLPAETDPESHGWLLNTLATCLERWLPGDAARSRQELLTGMLLAELRQGMGDRTMETLRFLLVHGVGPEVLALAETLALRPEESEIPNLDIAMRDRFWAVTSYVARGGRTDAIDRLRETYGDEDTGREVYVARAAIPTAEAKAQMFATWRQLDDPPEQWMSAALGTFHWPGHEALTLPYLQPALDLLDWVKANRRIFFMPSWLTGFLNGHSTQEALDIARSWRSANPELPDDIDKKYSQAIDGLVRAVAIRTKWSGD